MANVYYRNAGSTGFLINDEPTNDPLDPPAVMITQAQYQLGVLGFYQSIDLDTLKIKVSRSKSRVDSFVLDNAAIDAGRLYAVYIEDLSQLGYTQVDWDLDTVFQSSELSAPWDYATTDGFGFANRVTFPVGSHTIDAHVTYGGGLFTVSATFDVE